MSERASAPGVVAPRSRYLVFGRLCRVLRIYRAMLPVCIAWGCADETPPVAATTAVPLASRVVSADTVLGRPTGMEMIGGRLLVIDPAGTHALHVFDPQSGKLIHSLGRRGQGPGEYLGLWRVARDPNDTTVAWAFDASIRRFTRINVLAPPGEEVLSILDMHDGGPPLRVPLITRTGQIIAVGEFSDGRFALLDSAANVLRVVGPPPAGDTAVSGIARARAYGGSAAFNEQLGLVAVASRWAGRIEIFGLDGTSRVMADVPDPFEPDFDLATRSPGEPTFTPTRGTNREGYFDARATREYLFALFSGAPSTSEDYLPREVHVFSWDGELVRRFQLAHEVRAIAIDEVTGTMYGLRRDPEPQIVAFDISDLFADTGVPTAPAQAQPPAV